LAQKIEKIHIEEDDYLINNKMLNIIFRNFMQIHKDDYIIGDNENKIPIFKSFTNKTIVFNIECIPFINKKAIDYFKTLFSSDFDNIVNITINKSDYAQIAAYSFEETSTEYIIIHHFN